MSDNVTQEIQWARALEAKVPADASAIVVDIGGTRAKLGVVAQGRVGPQRLELQVSDLRDGDPVANLASAMTRFAGPVLSSIDMAVVTVPGFIDHDFDHILQTNNVPELQGRRLATELSDALGYPVVLERDTVLLLRGECRAGAAGGLQNVAGLFVGTGIGAAYVQEAGPFRGGGWALEIGHVPMRTVRRSLGGARYPSLEVAASGRALAELAADNGLAVGDVWAVERIPAPLREEREEMLRLHAFAISGMLAMLSPKVVVLGGGVVEMPGYPWDRLVGLVKDHAPLPDTVLPVDLRRARLGWQSVLHGALAGMEGTLPPRAAPTHATAARR